MQYNERMNTLSQNTPNLDKLPRTVELLREGAHAVLALLDQRKLPHEVAYIRTSDWREIVDAIKTLAVRGAPAIGVAGAAALACWASEEARALPMRGREERAAREAFSENLVAVAHEVANARPTAVNLSWAVRRATDIAQSALLSGATPQQAADVLFDEVKRMEAADEAANRVIGKHGAELLRPNSRVLTHCNAGSLATVFYGTALGVVYAAAEQGKIARVYADETRPVGQGVRLTAWELAQAGVPVTLLCDNMAANLMAQGKIDAVVVGADRIAANGDTANKIGTYGVAVLAAHHGIPFYVAAPASTFDASLETGASIPIEERDAREVAAPLPGVDVWNPAFDVTPAALITKIITEKGAFDPAVAARAVVG